jgi:hypothetical protein
MPAIRSHIPYPPSELSPVPVFGGWIAAPPAPPPGRVAVATAARVLVTAGVTGTDVLLGAAVAVAVGVRVRGRLVGSAVAVQVGAACRLLMDPIWSGVAVGSGTAVAVAVGLHATWAAA